MKLPAGILLFMLTASAGSAQTSLPAPPPLSPPPLSPPPMGKPGATGGLFSDLEKQVIQRLLGAAQASGAPALPKPDIKGTVETILRDTVSTTAGKEKGEEKSEGAEEKSRKRAKKKKKKKKKSRGRGRGRGKGLPPGLAKRKKLPPGLARQLERNGRLPPGLRKKSLPGHVEAELPPAKKGTERVIVGKDVVLIDKQSEMILDIIRDVVVGSRLAPGRTAD
jgi:Ni/Co efflux regulator RcnB